MAKNWTMGTLGRARGFLAALALGDAAVRIGDLKAAEDGFLRVLALSPGDPAASNNLAMVYLQQGRRLDEAERLARGALARDPALQPYVLDTLARIQDRRKLEE